MVLTRHQTKSKIVLKVARPLRLTDMPLDVLLEVFLLLHPLDLLYLARTTKELRAFLLDRRKASTSWTSAIGNVLGFPHCPDHISPPAYTHLAFVPVCHGCFGPCETVEWQLRMRCCESCFPKMTITQSDAIRNVYSNYHVELGLPRAGHLKLMDCGGNISIIEKPNQYTHIFSVRDWEVAEKRRRVLGVPLEEFIVEQDHFWEPILLHAQSCQDWEHVILEAKVTHLLSVRSQRVEGIKSKLKELGWTDISSSLSAYSNLTRNFLQLPEVRKLEPLTPCEWVDISPKLISWAQDAKTDISWKKYEATLVSVFQSIQEKVRSDTSLKVQPRQIDIAVLPVVPTTLVHAFDFNMSDKDLETKLRRVLPPAIRAWSSTAVEEFVQLVHSQLPPPQHPLHWAILRCRACPAGQRLRFDEALSHNHLWKQRTEDRRAPWEMSAYDQFIMGYGTLPRSIQNLRVDVTVSARVENLVKRMGQNLCRATYDTLRRSTVKMVCGLCFPEAEKMDFEAAFRHCLSTHLAKKDVSVWSRASARE